MFLKKTIGILIILSNIAGIGFLIYLAVMTVKEKYIDPPSEKDETPVEPVKKSRPTIANDDIIPDEDDLLKDMDLSDLDNLNLDDFD